MAQLAPGATLEPQLEVIPNWPFTAMEAMLSLLLPELVRVTVRGALVVPTVCLAKFSGVVGENVTTPVFSTVITESPRKSGTTASIFPSPLKSPVAGPVHSLPSR
jgi:hypothetical protein